MPLTDLVAPNAIVPALKVNGKKQAIQELSARAAKLTGQSERLILCLGRFIRSRCWRGA